MALVEGQLTPLDSAAGRSSVESRGFRAWLSRWRNSVWAPVLGRTLAVLGGMLVLATIGAFATLHGAHGHALELGDAPLGSARASSSALRPAAMPVLEERSGLAQHASATGGGADPRTSPPPAEPPRSPAVTEDGKVILNLANSADLQRLPGVGKKRAEAIVALREKLGGRFRRLTDLLRIRGIGSRRLRQLEPLVVLDAVAATAGSPSAAPARSPSAAP